MVNTPKIFAGDEGCSIMFGILIAQSISALRDVPIGELRTRAVAVDRNAMFSDVLTRVLIFRDVSIRLLEI